MVTGHKQSLSVLRGAPGGGEEKPRLLSVATVAPISGRHRRARQGQQKHLTPLVSLLLDNVLCLNHARDLG